MKHPTRHTPLAMFSWLLVLSVAAFTAVYGCTIFFQRFCHPIADDFWLASQARELGTLDATIHMHLTWGGRWGARLMQYGVWQHLDLVRTYSWLLGAITLIFASLVTLALTRLFNSRSAVIPAVIASAVCVATSARLLLPIPAETFFWATGAFENLLSVALLLYLVSQACDMKAAPRFWNIVVALLAMFFTGIHELYAAIWIGVLSALLLFSGNWAYVRSKGLMWLASLSGFLINVTAPGSRLRSLHRQDQQDLQDPGIMDIIVFAVSFLGRSIWLILSNPAAVATLLLVLVLSCLSRVHSGRLRILWIASLCLAAAPLVSGIAAYMLQTIGLPQRTANALFLLCFFGTVMLVFCAGQLRVLQQARPWLGGRALLIAGALHLGAALHAQPLGQMMWDLGGRAQHYNEFMLERFDHLANLPAGSDAVVVSRHHRLPSTLTLSIQEVDEDPEFWVNQFWAQYFGLSSIRSVPPPPDHDP